jgi:transposase
MEKITTVGLDLAKSVFQIHAIAEGGRVVVRRAFRRSQLLEFFRNIEPCLVGMGPARVLTTGRTRSLKPGIQPD